jgi:two-component system, sensor histidine kinase and response regulator
LANSKDINVQTALESNNPVLADKEMLKTILRNLVSNSVKYTYYQGIVIMSTQRLEHHLQFTVSDTGIGIPSDYLDRLFEPDCKLSQQGTGKEKGTGLGLILCKEFVEKHGGEIWVESEEGKGSDFHFTIPLVMNDEVG